MIHLSARVLALLSVMFVACSCSDEDTLPPIGVTATAASYAGVGDYQIGPGDDLNINVWHNTELTSHTPVRPDGRITMPLIGDIVAAGKTPTSLASEMQDKLKPFIKDPIVTVAVTQSVSPFTRQIRVIGEAAQPRAISYSSNMTILDVMIAVGGLTKYADGDRAVIVRVTNNVQRTYHVHLDSLIRDGNISDNVAVQPGDVLIIPQRFF